jgi:hypothetical protein
MQTDGGNEVDMDMDIDSEIDNSPNLVSNVSQLPAANVMYAGTSAGKFLEQHKKMLQLIHFLFSHAVDALAIFSVNANILAAAPSAATGCFRSTSATTARTETQLEGIESQAPSQSQIEGESLSW